MLAIYLQLIDNLEAISEFEQFYYQYRKLMYYIAVDIVKDKHLAEDVVSETFMNMAKHFDFIRTLGDIYCLQVKYYVVISVKNTAFNMTRKDKRHTEVFLEETEYEWITDNNGILDIIIEKENLDKITNVLKGLPELYRATMQLYVVCDYNIDEVASALGIRKHTVYKRIQRARKIIESELGRSK